MTEAEADAASAASTGWASHPPALVASCVFGAIGALLLVAGVLGGSRILVLGATAAGVASLAAVLVWRSQLIQAWHAARGDGPTASGGI